MSAPPSRPPRPRAKPVFRPNFLLVVLWLGFFYVLFAMAFALPELLRAFRELPPGPAELTPEELEQARNVAREAMAQGRRVWVALLSALLAVAAGIWLRWLPGFRAPR